MMNTGKSAKGRQPITLQAEPPVGFNAYDSVGKLGVGDWLKLENVDIRDGYIRHRRGYDLTERSLDLFDRVAAYSNFISEKVDEEITLMEIDGPLDTGHFYSTRSVDYVRVWGGASKLATNPAEKHTYVYAEGKVYFISPQDNYIFEIVEVAPAESGTWDRYQMWARPMGLAKLQISDLQENGFNPNITLGAGYTYALEGLIANETTFIPTVSGSPNRILSDGENRAEITMSESAPGVVEVAIPIADVVANEEITHIRLWRSKNTNVDPDTLDTRGSPNTLFVLGLLTRTELITGAVAGIFTFFDTASDSEIPRFNDRMKGETVSIDSATGFSPFEMERLPPAYTGTYHKGRIWLGHIVAESTGFPNDSSNLVVSGYTGTMYTELYDPAQGVIPCESGDGYRITYVQGVGEDLIVFKENSTGRIPVSQPLNPYEVLDAGRGVAYLHAAGYVVGRGVIGIVNDQDMVMLFTEALQWTQYMGPRNFSKAVLGAYTVTDPEVLGSKRLLQVVYWEGKIVLQIGEGRELFVLHTGEGFFWTKYHIPFKEHTSETMANIEALFLRDKGKELAFVQFTNVTTGDLNNAIMAFKHIGNDNTLDAQVDVTDMVAPLTPVKNPISWEVTPKPFEVQEGRGVLEQRYLSVEAAVHAAMSVSVSVCNIGSEVVANEAFALTPEDYTQGPSTQPPNFTVNESAVVEYQFFVNYKESQRTKVYGERLIYTIKGAGKVEMYPPVLYALVTLGVRPPSYNFSTYDPSDNEQERYSELNRDLAVHLSRPDMEWNIPKGEWLRRTGNEPPEFGGAIDSNGDLALGPGGMYAIGG